MSFCVGCEHYEKRCHHGYGYIAAWKECDLLSIAYSIAYSISKSIVSLLPSPCRATALSAARREGTFDLEKELLVTTPDRMQKAPDRA
jgi:hypothetical protein